MTKTTTAYTYDSNISQYVAKIDYTGVPFIGGIDDLYNHVNQGWSSYTNVTLFNDLVKKEIIIMCPNEKELGYLVQEFLEDINLWKKDI